MERFKAPILMVSAVLLLLFDVGSALNEEGVALLGFKGGIENDPYGYLANWEAIEGESSPCSWNGIGCEHGAVISLILEDRGLKGVVSAELGKLVHLKYLILHKNSFHGSVPREIGGLANLVILDLGHNDLSGVLPSDLGDLLSLELVVIKGNRFLHALPCHLQVLNSDADAYVRDLSSTSSRRYISRFGGNATLRKLLQREGEGDEKGKGKTSKSPASSPAPASLQAPASASTPSPTTAPSPTAETSQESSKNKTSSGIYIAVALASAAVLIVLVFFLATSGRKLLAGAVKPWASGLSGQLRDALKTGAPSLKRSELETACEDFSNILCSLSDGKLYKGTLSSGVEIAVAVLTPVAGWSKSSEERFRKKIEILSKLNHKNFVNLLGYCEEEKPFSRMLVFEYAPNGTLFEHLHIRESQELNWAARMRIAMGVAYCLDHMHRLDPPVVLSDLDSNLIHLTDDFAAKVADLELRSGTAESCMADAGALHGQMNQEQSIVLKFGVLLLELVSGKPSYSEEHGGVVAWAHDCLKGSKPLSYLVDSSLNPRSELDVMNIVDIVKGCLSPDPWQRLSMEEVVRRLRDVTSITPEDAAPKLSPLWWAELEIISTEG